MSEKVEINIRTWGEKVHSPRPQRREVYVEYNMSLRELSSYAYAFHYNLFIKPPFYPTFDEYIKFCKFCKREGDSTIRCLRHESVLQIPFQLSNHEYRYRIILEPERFAAEARVGASGWDFRLQIAEKKAEAMIKRPSGVTFTYRGEGEKDRIPFRIYLRKDGISVDTLYLEKPRSVFYLADRFIRYVGRLMDPLSLSKHVNVYVITPHDEFTIPVCD